MLFFSLRRAAIAVSAAAAAAAVATAAAAAARIDGVDSILRPLTGSATDLLPLDKDSGTGHGGKLSR